MLYIIYNMYVSYDIYKGIFIYYFVLRYFVCFIFFSFLSVDNLLKMLYLELNLFYVYENGS